MTARVFMFAKAEIDKRYSAIYYYRCPGLEAFLDKLESEAALVGIEVDGNSLGFIADPDKVEPKTGGN